MSLYIRFDKAAQSFLPSPISSMLTPIQGIPFGIGAVMYPVVNKLI